MKTILVPSDFSKNASVALRYAIRLSGFVKANLVVFHCAHISPYILSSASASDDQVNMLIDEDINFKTEKLLAQVSKEYKYLGIKKIPATTKIIVESNPMLVENIIEVAKKIHADLIVTATHGATGLNRFFFSSNTAALISKSQVPVLAIPEKHKYAAIRNIAFSSDLENLDYELGRLLPIAKALNANVDVLYFDYGIDTGKSIIAKSNTVISKSGYKKIKLVTRKATVDYSLVKQLKKYLATNKHQCLVMFTKERGFWNKIFYGGKTENMSYSMKIPLLSFKKQ